MAWTVFITGASSGIGLALTQAYLAQQWHVIACCRKPKTLTTLRQQYDRLDVLTFDMLDDDALAQAIDNLKRQPNVWLLNAGDCQYVEDNSPTSSICNDMIRLNYMACVSMIDLIIQRVDGPKKIGVVASMASLLPFARAQAYGASKAALAYYVSSMQNANFTDLSMTLILPGFIDTALTQKNDFPMPFLSSPQDLALAIINGMAKGKRQLIFPKRLYLILLIIKHLPQSLQARILGTKRLGDQQ